MLEFIGFQGVPDVWQVFLKFLVLAVGALIIIRLMGNRTVSQLSPFDFIILVGIGDIIISGAMGQRPTVLNGLMVLVVLLILQQLMGYLSLKSIFFRKLFEGVPITIVENGKVLKQNMVKTQFNYDDLRQEIHKKGLDMEKLGDIKVGWLESCGEFSIIMNPEAEPLSKRDFEDYLKSIYENPLSLFGEKWAKTEKFMADVEYLVDYLRQQTKQPSASDSNFIADGYLKKNPKELH